MKGTAVFPELRSRDYVTRWFVSGLFVTMLLTGCGLTSIRRGGAALPSQPCRLWPAPPEVSDRLTHVAPDLRFDLNSHDLRPTERRTLREIAQALRDILRDAPEVIIVVEGHCDDRGSIEYNKWLGQERAETVRRVLLGQGVAEDRVQAISIASRSPLCASKDDLCRQRNRRVHFSAAQVRPKPQPGKR